MSLEVGEGKAGVMSGVGGGVGGAALRLKKKEVERGGEGSGERQALPFLVVEVSARTSRNSLCGSRCRYKPDCGS